MSKLFLLNEAINLQTLATFKEGMNNLISIEKEKSHVFHKHHSIWDLPIYTQLCNQYGQEEQIIISYLEQLQSCDEYIDNEQKANQFCATSVNAFLGIEFINTTIPVGKRVIDGPSYQEWAFQHLAKIDKLKVELCKSMFSNAFEKAFQNLADDVQQSIIDGFNKARKRGLVTPFYPDTKIIKDVTQSNQKWTVLELRIYTPVALRVYFHEAKGVVYIASVEQKSNPNQTDDIKQAHKLLKEFLE